MHFQVPTISGKCVLRVEGLVPNQKYVFAVAAYNSQGKLVGNTIGETTFELLASMHVPLLSAWAHLAQVHYILVQKILYNTIYVLLVQAMWKNGRKRFVFLTLSLGGISNCAVCHSTESLQETVEPLYLF